LKRNSRQTPHPQPALGKAIRELRRKQDASLEALAPRAGLALNTLSLIERGQANPTWETVKQIAAALGVPVSELAKLAEKHDK
jgi:transcriptional regulator with XRE-family HTH domain